MLFRGPNPPFPIPVYVFIEHVVLSNEGRLRRGPAGLHARKTSVGIDNHVEAGLTDVVEHLVNQEP